MKAAILFNDKKEHTAKSVFNVAYTLLKIGADVFMAKNHQIKFNNLNIKFFENEEQAINESDVVLAVGGDGTIMRTVKKSLPFGKAVLGINSGKIGFMANLEKGQMSYLNELVNGKYKISKRMILEVQCGSESFFAVNELAINRATDSQVVQFKVSRLCTLASSFRADGIVVSTPTGSTAYSLSAGGPIVDSTMECFVVTPVCAHSLSARTLILNSYEPIIVQYAPESGSKVAISIDGQICFWNNEAGSVKVVRSDLCANFVVLNSGNCFSNIDEKVINKICF